jgi:hypothetical protein
MSALHSGSFLRAPSVAIIAELLLVLGICADGSLFSRINASWIYAT